MTKIKKISAMVLAVLMMMVVLTGCGGGASGTALFIQRTNEARRAHGYNTVEEDSDLDQCAKLAMSNLKSFAQSSSTSYELSAKWNAYVNGIVGKTGTMSHGYGKITYIDLYKATPAQYASGDYILSDKNISYKNGNCIGLYAENIEGLMYIVVVLATV